MEHTPRKDVTKYSSKSSGSKQKSGKKQRKRHKVEEEIQRICVALIEALKKYKADLETNKDLLLESIKKDTLRHFITRRDNAALLLKKSYYLKDR